MRASGMLIVVVGILFLFTGLTAAKNVFDTLRRQGRPGLRAMLEEVEAEIAAAADDDEST
jgi:hypothetical protein